MEWLCDMYTLDTLILASKNFHTYWLTRLISNFNVKLATSSSENGEN